MAASDMMSALMELCQEKHIDQLYLIDRLEQSLAKSYAEILHLEWGAKVTIDRTTGKIYVYRLEPIDDSMDEEGNFTEFEEIDVTPKNTSRIAAQHAKAEINAIVRNSAREQLYEEFSGRIGDLISGTVLQSTPDFTIVKIRDGVDAEGAVDEVARRQQARQFASTGSWRRASSPPFVDGGCAHADQFRYGGPCESQIR